MSLNSFTSIDADEARDFFKNKSKTLSNKLTTLDKAIKQYVHDGDYLGIGGFGTNRIPTAALHEIVRQKKKNLGFAGHTATHDCQILLAGDCVNRCDVAYVVGLEARGLSTNARRGFQSGNIKVIEWTNGALSWRLKAAAMGLSFIPARVMLGTDTMKYSGAKEILCPFTNKKYVALPALSPDISIIHVHQADMYGNCYIEGNSVADCDLAKASKHLIITAEEIISNDTIREKPHRTSIMFMNVDAVVEVPYGSYPANMPYCYFSDEQHLKEWLDAEKDPIRFKEFLQENIYDCKDFYEYLEKNGGMKKLHTLRQKEYTMVYK